MGIKPEWKMTPDERKRSWRQFWIWCVVMAGLVVWFVAFVFSVMSSY